MKTGPEIRVVHADYRMGYNVFIEQIVSSTHFAIAKPIEMETHVTKDLEMFAPSCPALTLNKTSAQQLMDDLWTCGLRPSEGTGSAGALAAVNRHLEDMRTLVFKEN